MKRKIKLLGLSSLTLILLAACGRSEVTASSTNGWDQIVYFFAKAIQWLSINGRIGVGIVLFHDAALQYANQIRAKNARLAARA